MKSLLDPSFEYSPSYEADIQHIFARVRRELAEREGADADADFGVERNSLWLECTGEQVDAASVNIVGVRTPALVTELVEFVCPRCNQRHESLRFS